MTAANEPHSGLAFASREPDGEPSGLLVLHHGRGADEHDLLPVADAVDPRRSLLVVAPRAPLQPPGAVGNHWYLVPRVGYPDHDTFHAAFRRLAAFHDALWESSGLGPEHTVLGGFSMGTVMSYALALSGERPAPAGILAFSGFIPTVDGWESDLSSRTGTRVFIAHGRRDPVIGVDFARTAQRLLGDAGLRVEYHESDAGHHIDPTVIPAASRWLHSALPPPPTPDA
jgi:phospholipase/carboxylesterase